MKNLYNKLWTNIINNTSNDPIAIHNYRYIFIFIFVFYFIPTDTLWITDAPDALYNPPKLSIGSFFSGFPSYTVLFIINVLIVVGLFMISLNKYSNIAGIITFLLIIINLNFKYSLGKIDHDILLYLTLLCFSLCNWRFDVSKENKILPIPPETLLAIFIAFGMFTAGIQKATNWIDFDMQKSGFLAWFNSGYYNQNRTLFLASMIPKLPMVVIELMDYFTVIFELAPFPILLFGSKKLWKMWLITACLFHIGVILFLNITFVPHILVYLPFLIPAKFFTNFGKIGKSVFISAIGICGIIQIYLMTNSTTIMREIIGSRSILLIVSLVLLSSVVVIGIYSMYLDSKKPVLETNPTS
ncbi:hypothetical protein K6119_11390 [Paracrocinitomix mangrovi]|uniref:hypothetical protein n=1 Tax=Paracrocinitomix mangrovi TaxID=2862509 RepID=UPI001C8DF8C9|nr:hypothetical protein [Paracrocinitomix mangrovi]UKN00338.1 hypothetical protein K6119_11390 [Paracrocinitomix mangrovi]